MVYLVSVSFGKTLFTAVMMSKLGLTLYLHETAAIDFPLAFRAQPVPTDGAAHLAGTQN